MATTKFTGQDLAVGQWVNLDTMFRVDFAGQPAKVVEVKPKSVLVAELTRWRTGEAEINPPRIRRLTNITFVSDSQEEAEAMLAANRVFTDAEFEMEKQFKTASNARRQAAIDAALTESKS